MLAKRMQIQKEQKEPSTRQRSNNAHQVMINAIGYRSFGSKSRTSKILADEKLPEASTLKSVRQTSKVLSPRTEGGRNVQKIYHANFAQN